jgi:hypothetical protein
MSAVPVSLLYCLLSTVFLPVSLLYCFFVHGFSLEDGAALFSGDCDVDDDADDEL